MKTYELRNNCDKLKKLWKKTVYRSFLVIHKSCGLIALCTIRFGVEFRVQGLIRFAWTSSLSLISIRVRFLYRKVRQRGVPRSPISLYLKRRS